MHACILRNERASEWTNRPTDRQTEKQNDLKEKKNFCIAQAFDRPFWITQSWTYDKNLWSHWRSEKKLTAYKLTNQMTNTEKKNVSNNKNLQTKREKIVLVFASNTQNLIVNLRFHCFWVISLVKKKKRLITKKCTSLRAKEKETINIHLEEKTKISFVISFTLSVPDFLSVTFNKH